jgi:hypothetical protein
MLPRDAKQGTNAAFAMIGNAGQSGRSERSRRPAVSRTKDGLHTSKTDHVLVMKVAGLG